MKKLIKKLGKEKAKKVLEEAVRKSDLKKIQKRCLTTVDDRPLPQELVDDWKAVFGTRSIGGMNGWRARTLEGRIDLIKEIIYCKIAFNQVHQVCPCGCGYIYGCGTP